MLVRLQIMIRMLSTKIFTFTLTTSWFLRFKNCIFSFYSVSKFQFGTNPEIHNTRYLLKITYLNRKRSSVWRAGIHHRPGRTRWCPALRAAEWPAPNTIARGPTCSIRTSPTFHGRHFPHSPLSTVARFCKAHLCTRLHHISSKYHLEIKCKIGTKSTHLAP